MVKHNKNINQSGFFSLHRSDLSDRAQKTFIKIFKVLIRVNSTTLSSCLWSQEASRVFYRLNSNPAMIHLLINITVSSWWRWRWYPACCLVWIGLKIPFPVLYQEQLVLMVDLFMKLVGYKVSVLSSLTRSTDVLFTFWREILQYCFLLKVLYLKQRLRCIFWVYFKYTYICMRLFQKKTLKRKTKCFSSKQHNLRGSEKPITLYLDIRINIVGDF